MKKHDIEEMQKIATGHGGKCLSSVYVNFNAKLKWKCKKGHTWKAAPRNILRGYWCRKCGGTERGSIEEMHNIAKTNGGKCLSEIYVNNRTKLLWECSEGHRWKAVPTSIKNRGSWCKICRVKARAESRKYTIEDMHKIAQKCGGKCLSATYVDCNTKLSWECELGHQWPATPVSIFQGKWCSECSTGLGERICREFFEQLFCEDFIKSRPKWLVNSRGNQMELDGYCQSLGMAFEHHGRQHYSTDSIFMNSSTVLKIRQKDDKQKRILCQQNGIALIEVPEIPTILPIDDVKHFIKKECQLKGVSLPSSFDTKKVKLEKALVNKAQIEAIKELCKIAQAKGGKCLSKKYVNAYTKLLWKCSEGHKWQATPNSIKNGRWCKKCGIKRGAESRKDDINIMHRLAEESGGKCLSVKYINSATKLLWKCSEGHRWKAAPRDIKSGHWCKKCGDKRGSTVRKLGIGKMHRLAEESDGKCLSTEYVNNKTKILWECTYGHRWEATPNNVQRGSWCKVCYDLSRGKSHRLHK